jgi:hypothetical protein
VAFGNAGVNTFLVVRTVASVVHGSAGWC